MHQAGGAVSLDVLISLDYAKQNVNKEGLKCCADLKKTLNKPLANN